jgi:hypothetical protein
MQGVYAAEEQCLCTCTHVQMQTRWERKGRQVVQECMHGTLCNTPHLCDGPLEPASGALPEGAAQLQAVAAGPEG